MYKLKEDFYTDDACSCGILIPKGSTIFVHDTESDGTCYAEWLDMGFSINIELLERSDNSD